MSKAKAATHAEPSVEVIQPVGIADVSLAEPSAVIRHRFTPVEAGVPSTLAPANDLTAFIRALEAALTQLAGLSCKINSSSEPASDSPDRPVVSWYVAGDSRLGIALSTTLAEALMNARCGGSLTGHGGRLRSAASVMRLQAEVVTLLLRTAAANWLSAEAEWTVAAPAAIQPPLQALTITVGDLSCPLDIAVGLALPAASTGVPTDWAGQRRRSIEHLAFPVRAVLFETRLPLAKAVQLRPGDLLPIETPRDVGLRVGAYRLASGTISPAGGGGHLVTICASPRSICPPSIEKASL